MKATVTRLASLFRVTAARRAAWSVLVLLAVAAAQYAAPALAGPAAAHEASLTSGGTDNLYAREAMDPAVAGRKTPTRTPAEPASDDDGQNAAVLEAAEASVIALAATVRPSPARHADTPRGWHSRAPPAI